VERIPDVAAGAEKNLDKAGIKNVTVIVSDGTEGYPAGAPYDCILITAAAPDIPAPLVDQLKDGGRLVAPVGSRDLQILVKLEKHGSAVTRTSHGGVVFVPLLGRYGWNQ
jgi:Protein-L-isoaspartate carboxylmethyltransferase